MKKKIENRNKERIKKGVIEDQEDEEEGEKDTKKEKKEEQRDRRERRSKKRKEQKMMSGTRVYNKGGWEGGREEEKKGRRKQTKEI